MWTSREQANQLFQCPVRPICAQDRLRNEVEPRFRPKQAANCLRNLNDIMSVYQSDFELDIDLHGTGMIHTEKMKIMITGSEKKGTSRFDFRTKKNRIVAIKGIFRKR